MSDFTMKDFVTESNLIENIHRVTDEEVQQAEEFMELKTVMVDDLIKFVSVYKPTARLRESYGMNIYIGNYTPMRGGLHVRIALDSLLKDIEAGLDSYEAHIRYESIHPFSDGNGRSGRMLWAWQQGYVGLGLLFLHMFYYQTLAHSVRKETK